MGATGRPKPIESNRVSSSLAKPTPATMPVTDASTPITSASSSTERSTWRRLAPIVRSIANSRVRWATVIANVLKMMNAPANTVAPANASNSGVRKSLMPPAVSLACSAAASGPVCTFTSLGNGLDDALLQLVLADAGFGLDRDRRRLADAVEPLLRVGEGGADDGGATDGGGGAELEYAHQRDRLQALIGGQLQVLAELQVLVVGQLRVDDHIAAV